MSLVEYKSPVVKKPKFGWQRYQFGNKSAAALKTSLWAANLSEITVINASPDPIFGPVYTKVKVVLTNQNSVPLPTVEINTQSLTTAVFNVTDLISLVQTLNKIAPYMGEFRPNAAYTDVELVVDKTWTDSSAGDLWKLNVDLS
jgi:hypothetical protein